MNSCYGCILQAEGVWQVHPYCKSCSSEGSHYFARPDFDEWHAKNARQNTKESPVNAPQQLQAVIAKLKELPSIQERMFADEINSYHETMDTVIAQLTAMQ